MDVMWLFVCADNLESFYIHWNIVVQVVDFHLIPWNSLYFVEDFLERTVNTNKQITLTGLKQNLL